MYLSAIFIDGFHGAWLHFWRGVASLPEGKSWGLRSVQWRANTGKEGLLYIVWVQSLIYEKRPDPPYHKQQESLAEPMGARLWTVKSPKMENLNLTNQDIWASSKFMFSPSEPRLERFHCIHVPQWLLLLCLHPINSVPSPLSLPLSAEVHWLLCRTASWTTQKDGGTDYCRHAKNTTEQRWAFSYSWKYAFSCCLPGVCTEVN